MGFLTSIPSALLSPYIHQYWEIESCMPSGQTHVQRIIPSGLMELMHYQLDLPTVVQKDYEIPAGPFISGQQKGYYDISVTGKLSLFSVQFKPCGAYAFFDIPMNEFFDRNIPLELFLKNCFKEIEDQLNAASGFQEKCSIVDQFLSKLLMNRQKEYAMNRILHCIQIVDKQKGMVSIDHLADKACLGRKQLERNFKEFIGSTPRQFLKVVRFQNSLFQKSICKQLNITELAHECGYFDQSHMTNDYKELSGMTPGEYFDTCDPVSDYFTLNV